MPIVFFKRFSLNNFSIDEYSMRRVKKQRRNELTAQARKEFSYLEINPEISYKKIVKNPNDEFPDTEIQAAMIWHRKLNYINHKVDLCFGKYNDECEKHGKCESCDCMEFIEAGLDDISFYDLIRKKKSIVK